MENIQSFSCLINFLGNCFVFGGSDKKHEILINFSMQSCPPCLKVLLEFVISFEKLGKVNHGELLTL